MTEEAPSAAPRQGQFVTYTGEHRGGFGAHPALVLQAIGQAPDHGLILLVHFSDGASEVRRLVQHQSTWAASGSDSNRAYWR